MSQEIVERPDYQVRVIVEAEELEGKVSRLAAFRTTPTFEALDPMERSRLNLQEIGMNVYLMMLKERIAAFGGAW